MPGQKLINEAVSGNLDGVKRLIAQGTDVNFANRGGVTALMVASQWNRAEVADVLLENGADVDATESESGRNALMYSCLSGDLRVLRRLLESGAAVNAADGIGRTALMMAATIGSTRAVELLLQNGADIHARDSSGATALDWAYEARREEVVNLLLTRGAVIANR